MAALTSEEKDLLGPIIKPFGRSTKPEDHKKIATGEGEIFQHAIYDGIDNGEPDNCIFLTIEEIENHIKVFGRFADKCFLWVIDEVSIKIIREKTRNTMRTHKNDCVCHTNITGSDGSAFIGGEMFFGEDGNIYINHFSGRFGDPTESQWENAKKYIRSVGYTNLIDIIELLKQD